MAGWTNRGKFLLCNHYFRDVLSPVGLTAFRMALCTNDVTPTPDTNVLGDLTEITAGNGYAAGGNTVARNATDWDVLVEDDTNDRAYIQCVDQVWTASGGPIPSGGNGARWAVLTTDEGTVANRQVICYWDLAFDRSVSAGQTLTIQNGELRLNGFAGITNRGAFLMLKSYFQNLKDPVGLATFYLALLDQTSAPSADYDTLGALAQIPAGNGYTAGGQTVARNATDWDVLTEDDTNDRAFIQMVDKLWTASGGAIPASGTGARYSVLTTDEGTVGNRQVIAQWDLGANWMATDGQNLRLADSEIRINES